MATVTRANLRTAPEHIANRQDFNCNGTLTGVNGDFYPFTGRLPERFHAALKDASKSNDDFYLVKSYSTPIAWYSRGQWFMPVTRYSSTTSRHQSRVMLAVGRGQLNLLES